MQEWLAYRAEATPDRLALRVASVDLSFRDLERRTAALAAHLASRGVRRRHRVAVLLPNGLRSALLVYALMRLQAVLVPLNTRLAPPEVAWQVADCRPRLFVRDTAFEAAGRAAAERLPLLAQWVPPPDEEAVADGWPGPAPGARRALRPADVAADAVQAVVYTSGTTGRPKGAMLTYGNHWHSAVAATLNLGHRPDDRWLCCLPLFHVGGLAILMRGVVCGTAALIHSSFDPAAVNRAIDREGVTGVSLVSEMLRRVLADRDGRPAPPWFRQVLLGGGPAPLPLLEACARGGVPVVQSYGLTETASQVAALAPEDALGHPGSAGRALPGSQLRIARHGRTVRPGAVGEILVRGPTVMAGYFGRPEASRAALAGGWLHTGDLGRLDAQGRLHVLSRRDDLIVRGGENVYPAEIESVLAEHPLVLESGVTAVADQRWGQAPVANVRLRAGTAAGEAELIAFCRQRLAAYKVPVRVLKTGPLPRNAAGKLLRGRLRTADETAASPPAPASGGMPDRTS